MNGKDILKVSLLAFLFLGLVVAWLGFGERGFIHLYRMDTERQAYLERINKLERENRELLEEIQRLRSDRDYVENLGRRELGLVKEDELMYRFETTKEKDKQNHRNRIMELRIRGIANCESRIGELIPISKFPEFLNPSIPEFPNPRIPQFLNHRRPERS